MESTSGLIEIHGLSRPDNKVGKGVVSLQTAKVSGTVGVCVVLNNSTRYRSAFVFKAFVCVGGACEPQNSIILHSLSVSVLVTFSNLEYLLFADINEGLGPSLRPNCLSQSPVIMVSQASVRTRLGLSQSFCHHETKALKVEQSLDLLDVQEM